MRSSEWFVPGRTALLITLALILSACGGSSSSPGVDPDPDPDPVSTASLSGIAATGAPIDGATVEAFDATGAALDLVDAVTGSDGGYSVEIPLATGFPVLLRIMASDGTVLTAIANQPPAADGDVVLAHVNPVTDLVAGELLGESVENPSELAAALGGLDPGEPAASGEAVMQDLFGTAVSFERFASDAEFAAKTGDTSGSLADAMLDVLGNRARESEQGVMTLLAELRDQPDPPRLLEAPGFQVELLAERIREGIDTPEALGTELRAFGALSEDPGDPADDTLEALVVTVPAVLSAVREQAGSEISDPALVDLAANAATRTLRDALQLKRDRFAADDASIAATASGAGFRDGIISLVGSTLTPLLSAVATAAGDDGVAEATRSALARVSQRIAEEAARAISALDLNREDVAVVEIARRFLHQRLAGVDAETIAGIASGEVDLDQRLPASADIRDVQAALRQILTDDPSLGDDTLIALATGRWNEDSWNEFIWH
ncbi:MAG: hypothetical protein EA417_15555 [Gammaproteobacteria bacterium]|nr:MAG: hypothetical protein EA417_15555 [Gammaproteobacteria bacterium]